MIDDQLYLYFRVGNMRRSHIIDGQIRAILVQHERKEKRNTYQMGLHEIKVHEKCLENPEVGFIFHVSYLKFM